MVSEHSHARRDFLRASGATAGLVTVGLAGCLGEDNGDDDGTANGNGNDADMSLLYSTGPDDSAGYAIATAVGAVVDEGTEELSLDVRPGGTAANMLELDQGEADLGLTNAYNVALMVDDEEPFDELTFEPATVFYSYSVDYFFGTTNEDWEYVSDIEPGSNVAIGPAGTGTQDILRMALDQTIGLDDYEPVSMAWTDQGGALAEGRLDTSVGVTTNQGTETGWMDENKAAVDYRALNWEEDDVEILEDAPGIEMIPLDMSGYEGYEDPPDELWLMSIPHHNLTRVDVDYDAIYTLLETMYEGRDELGRYHALAEELEDPEFWLTNPYDGVPYHPAAADFYEEIGIWSDDLERAD